MSIAFQEKTHFTLTNATSIAISGNGLVLAVGVNSYNINGGIYIYDLVNSTWQFRNIITSTYVPIEYNYNGKVGDYISINYDGSRVITNINTLISGSQKAVCLVFNYLYGTWNQSSFIYLQDSSYCRFTPINLSSDGNKIALSFYNIEDIDVATYIYFYTYSNGQYTYSNLYSDSNVYVNGISFNSIGSQYLYSLKMVSSGVSAIYSFTNEFMSNEYIISLSASNNTQYVALAYGSKVDVYPVSAYPLVLGYSIPIGADRVSFSNDSRVVFINYATNTIYDYEIYTPIIPEEPVYQDFYYIDGTVKEKINNIDTLVSNRIVRAYNRETGNFLNQTISDTNGYYKIENLPQNFDSMYIVCLDDISGLTYNSLIKDRITPKKETREI